MAFGLDVAGPACERAGHSGEVRNLAMDEACLLIHRQPCPSRTEWYKNDLAKLDLLLLGPGREDSCGDVGRGKLKLRRVARMQFASSSVQKDCDESLWLHVVHQDQQN